MKALLPVLFALGCCWSAHRAHATEMDGVLVQGGGTDDMHLVVRPAKGDEVWVYCVDRCGDWFESGEAESQHLRPSLIGRRIRLSYALEPNRGRIAGEDAEQPLAFIQSLQFVAPSDMPRPRACSQEIGPVAAARLVQQCIRVSPATHPPCNAANACSEIQDEVDRGCHWLKDDPKRPTFCK